MGETICIGHKSIRKLPFKCKCGLIKNFGLGYITSGNTKSCGNCRTPILNWSIENNLILKSKSKFTIDEFPKNGIIPLENIMSARRSFLALCVICNRKYRPTLSDIRRNTSLTCGCSSNRISSQNIEISNNLEKLGLKTTLEYKVKNRYFDVFVKDKNLLIEYNGSRWHNDKSITRDAQKKEIAINNGYKFLCITEDEWKKNKDDIVRKIRDFSV